MIPEVRRILAPIYEELHDHPSVLERLPVPGMGSELIPFLPRLAGIQRQLHVEM
jgi:hypothetical protein